MWWISCPPPRLPRTFLLVPNLDWVDVGVQINLNFFTLSPRCKTILWSGNASERASHYATKTFSIWISNTLQVTWPERVHQWGICEPHSNNIKYCGEWDEGNERCMKQRLCQLRYSDDAVSMQGPMPQQNHQVANIGEVLLDQVFHFLKQTKANNIVTCMVSLWIWHISEPARNALHS